MVNYYCSWEIDAGIRHCYLRGLPAFRALCWRRRGVRVNRRGIQFLIVVHVHQQQTRALLLLRLLLRLWRRLSD